MELYPKIKLYHMEQNMGVAFARNYGTKLAEGEYIAFLDSDDIWMPEKLETQILYMQKENIVFSYTSYTIINERGTQIGVYDVPLKVTYYDMLKTSLIGTLTMVYNAKKLGKFYFKSQGHEDYILKLQILKNIDYARGLTRPMAKYRVTKNSLSRNKIKTALWQWKIYREHENLSVWRSLYYFIHYVYFGLKKY
jgi:glycosyltransferase involved in cell wall biosynthesis